MALGRLTRPTHRPLVKGLTLRNYDNLGKKFQWLNAGRARTGEFLARIGLDKRARRAWLEAHAELAPTEMLATAKREFGKAPLSEPLMGSGRDGGETT